MLIKSVLISLLLITFLSAQDKIIIDGLSLTYSVVSGYSAYYQMKDRHYYKTGETELKEKYNGYWHTTQGIELALSLSLGGYAVYKNKDNWLEYAKDAFMFVSIRWFFRDGIYNSLNGNSWFHQSKNTTAVLEPLGYWYVKVILLTGAILWKYFL